MHMDKRMESRARPKKRAKRATEENRKRKRNLVIRFNDAERAMLDEVAAAKTMTVSEWVRYAVRRDYEAGRRRGT
jgi:hypothetical protein